MQVGRTETAMTRLLLAAVLGAFAVGCGDGLTGPSGMTQALIVSNNSWRMSYNGINRVGDNTAGDVIDLGSGNQCASARLSLARRLPPGESYLTLTVGQNSETIRTDERAITVCGTGPVGVEKNPARSAP